MNKGLKVIKKISGEYANTAIKTAISLIPVIGGALNEIFSHRINSLKEKRLLIFISNTEEEFKNIDENKINKKFLESDHFIDLVLKCINQSLKTSSIEKAKLFSRVLKNSLLTDNFNIQEFEEIEFIFEQISTREFLFLNRLRFWKLKQESEWDKEKKIDLVKFKSKYNSFEDEMVKEYSFTLNELFIIGKTCQQKGLVDQPNLDYGKKGIFRAFTKTSTGYLMTIQPTILHEHLLKFVQISEEIK